MARMEITGFDELINTMQTRADGTDARIDRALTLAGAALRAELVRQEMSTFKAPSGELGSLIPEHQEIHRDGSEVYVEVYPTGRYLGTRARQTRRAEEIAFVLEYGHGNVAANPWNKRARKKSQRRVEQLVREALTVDT